MTKQHTISAADWYRDELLKWGMNFHWHPWEPVAEQYTPSEFARQFRKAGIRTVSLEAKCGLGWSYYPTQFGVIHPRLNRDNDTIFDYFGDRVNVVKEQGGRVLVYYCLGMEGPLLEQHPDWRWHTVEFWDAEKKDFWLPPHKANTWELTSLFSPYVDEVLLPQLEEIIEDYDIDVIWLDIFYTDRGHPDYNPFARRQFEDETGRTLLPQGDDPDFPATVAYFRQAGRRVRRRIYDHIHAVAQRSGREVQVAFNWLHAVNRPPIRGLDESFDADILTCDVVQGICGNVYELGLQARYFVNQGLPSDVISTDFRWWGEWDLKPPDVLRREAAITIANGSTYYIYDYAYSHGRFDSGRIQHLRGLADWVAERESLFLRTAHAHRVRSQGEIALMVSTQTSGATPPAYWLAECFRSLEGASKLLQNGGICYQVCDEWTLAASLPASRLLILTQALHLDQLTADIIIRWVEAGGKLLIVGPVPQTMTEHFGIEIDQSAIQAVSNYTDDGPLNEFSLTGIEDVGRTGYGYLSTIEDVDMGIEFVPLIVWGRFFPYTTKTGDSLMNYRHPLAKDALAEGADYGAIMGYSAPGEEAGAGVSLLQSGEGSVLVCGVDVFRSFWVQPNYRFPQLLRAWFRALGYQPDIEVIEDEQPASGIELIAISEGDESGSRLIHLINLREANMAGMSIPNLPVVKGLKLRFHSQVYKARLLPEEENMLLQYANGCTDIPLPPLRHHLCIEVR